MLLFKHAHVAFLATLCHYLFVAGHWDNRPFFFLSSLWQCSAIWTQSTGMVLSDEDGPEKEITPVRQTSPPPPHNNRSCTTMATPPLPSWSPPHSPNDPIPLSLVKSSFNSIQQTYCPASMATPFLWKLSSQKLGFFLVSFGFIWGMMLLHFTIQQRASHESSAVLKQQILDLSKRYIKALAEENQSVMDGPYVGTMTAYGEWHYRKARWFWKFSKTHA